MNHSHVLYDSDPHFNIDPISRNITNESSKKVRLIQHDHNSERFTFEIPQHIEGHDMSACNLVEIHYVNVESDTKVVRGGVYTVDDLHVSSDNGDLVVFSWLIPNKATQHVGQLQFLVRFSCVNENTGKVEYVWNTGIYTGISVSSGIYNSDSPSDNPVPPYNSVTTVDGRLLKFFVGSIEEYNKLGESGLIVADCLYMFEDDTTLEEIENAIADCNASIEDINTRIYEVASQKKPSIYRHNVYLTGATCTARMTIISEQSSKYTLETLAVFLQNNDATGATKNSIRENLMNCYPATGWKITPGGGVETKICYGVLYDATLTLFSEAKIVCLFTTPDGAGEYAYATSLVDDVVKIEV